MMSDRKRKASREALKMKDLRSLKRLETQTGHCARGAWRGGAPHQHTQRVSWAGSLRPRGWIAGKRFPALALPCVVVGLRTNPSRDSQCATCHGSARGIPTPETRLVDNVLSPKHKQDIALQAHGVAAHRIKKRMGFDVSSWDSLWKVSPPRRSGFPIK